MENIDEVNILFISNGSSGKTTIISGMCNKICGSIKKFGGTKRIAVYNMGNLPSFYTDNIDHYTVTNLDLDIPNVNIIDTIGYYKNDGDIITDTFISSIINSIDLIICVIDVNIPFDKNIINKWHTLENILFVINKCDDLSDLDIQASIKEISDNISSKNIISLSSDNILCCKSLLHHFSNEIPVSKMRIFNAIFGTDTQNMESKILDSYYEFTAKIKQLLPTQSIFDNKIKKYIDNIDSIKNLIDLSKKYSVSHKTFNNNLSFIVDKYSNEKNNKLLCGILDDIEYIKNNTTLQHYISNLVSITQIFSGDGMLDVIINLSQFDIIFKKILCQLLHLNIDNNNVNDIIKYLLLIDRNVLINNITFIDEISFTIMKYLLLTIADIDKLIVLSHIDMHFQLYCKFLPITSKLKYCKFDINNDVIINNNSSLVLQRIDMLLLFDVIFNNHTNDLHNFNKKNTMINKLLDEKFAIFPCIDKYPLCKQWNYIDYIQSQKLKDKLITKNIGLVCGELSNIFIIDVDQKDNGMEYWTTLLKQYNSGEDIDTLSVNTANNGKHYYFKLDDDVKLLTTKNKIFSDVDKKIGIDIRNNNGYVIMPYSYLDTTRTYQFANYDEKKLFRDQIKSIPEWLKTILNNYYEKNNYKCEIIEETDLNDAATVDEESNLNHDFDDYHNFLKKNLNKGESFIAINNGVRISVTAKNPRAASKKASTIFHKISKNTLNDFNIQIIKQLSNNKKKIFEYF
jgi:hypothetical protein